MNEVGLMKRNGKGKRVGDKRLNKRVDHVEFAEAVKVLCAEENDPSDHEPLPRNFIHYG